MPWGKPSCCLLRSHPRSSRVPRHMHVQVVRTLKQGVSPGSGRQRSARRHPQSANVKVTRWKQVAHRKTPPPAHHQTVLLTRESAGPGEGPATHLPPNTPLDSLHPRKPPKRAGKAGAGPSLMGHRGPHLPRLQVSQTRWRLCTQRDATSPRARTLPSLAGHPQKRGQPSPCPCPGHSC